jgi:hypothetical protein
MNGLTSFTVIDGTNKVWEIKTSYEKGSKIVYGILPTGGNMAAEQAFPPKGLSPSAIIGKAVTVKVGYQYDHDWSPCDGYFEKLVVIPSSEPSESTNASLPNKRK